MSLGKIPVAQLANLRNKLLRWNGLFVAYSKTGGGDGTSITLPQSDKWMKQANVIDNDNITNTDTLICFKKLKSPSLTLVTYNQFLADLAITKGTTVDELKAKMLSCGLPGSHKVALVKIVQQQMGRYAGPLNDDLAESEQRTPIVLTEEEEDRKRDSIATSWADFRKQRVLESMRNNIIPKK